MAIVFYHQPTASERRKARALTEPTWRELEEMADDTALDHAMVTRLREMLAGTPIAFSEEDEPIPRRSRIVTYKPSRRRR